MKEHLECLIQTIKETRLAERILATHTMTERSEVYRKARNTPEFQEYIRFYEQFICSVPEGTPCLNYQSDFEHTEENLVAIAIIFAVIDFCEEDMFGEENVMRFYRELYADVKGKYERLARQLANYLMF